ncbi:hypothetical protein [Sphaerochaeta pleomorpha]|uniref:hypothetical protein n=1 Tax=Sphaerochaeta pleomorpha TaxID=1131707 RepID=UPI0003053408|nr:hypothetical protein [Sphaerochaeta pleomorpha]
MEQHDLLSVPYFSGFCGKCVSSSRVPGTRTGAFSCSQQQTPKASLIWSNMIPADVENMGTLPGTDNAHSCCTCTQ